MSDSQSGAHNTTDPMDEKLSRVPAPPEEIDGRLRRLLSRIEASDQLAERIRTALITPDVNPPVDPAVMEVDTWWRLQEYLAQGLSIDGVRDDVSRLAAAAERWGDSHGAVCLRNLGAVIAATRESTLDETLQIRAEGRSHRLPSVVRQAVIELDSLALAYVRTRGSEVLKRASLVCHELLMSDRRTQAEPILQLSLFCDAAVLMREVYYLSPDPVLLDRSVRCWQASVQCFRDPSVFPSLALLNVSPRLDLVVMNLAAAQMKRFQLNHLGEDLNDAIQHFTAAVLLTLPDSPLLPSRLAALGSALRQAGDEETVAHGIDLLFFASSLEGDAARRTSLVAQLVAWTWERHQRFRSPESLEATLNARRLVEQWTGERLRLPEVVERGLQRMGPESEGPLAAVHVLKRLAATTESDAALDGLNVLAGTMLNQYRVNNDTALLDRAASALEVLLSRTPAGTEPRRIAIKNAATCLKERYQRRGSPHDLERVIELLQEELALSPGDAALLNNFGGALMLRHRATGSTDDLDQGIDAMETALKQTEASATGAHGRYLHSLAVALLDRWHLEGDPRDLRRALEAIDESLTAPNAQSSVTELLSLKATCLGAQYDASHDVRYLDESLALCRKLLADLPIDAKERAGNLHQLGVSLRARYAIDRNPDTLSEAIAAFTGAVSAVLRSNPDWSAYESDRGTALLDRYGAIGNLQDLQDAIAAHRRALAAATSSVDRVLVLTHLTVALRVQARHSHELTDLESALAAAREALALCPTRSPLRVNCLNSLATASFERYRWTAESGPTARAAARAADLDEAIANFELALEIRGPSPTCLNNLGMALTALYLRDADPTALDRAVEALEAALASPSAPATDLPAYWLNLGIALKNQALRSRNASDVERAANAFRQSCEKGQAVSTDAALRAALDWASWALLRAAFVEAAEASDYGIATLQRLFRAQVTRAQKETWLKEAQGLPVLAAYARARADNDATRAVEALEQGRALVLSEALEIDRADLERLSATQSDLARRYHLAATRWMQLSTNPPVAGEGLPGTTLPQALRDARDELDAVIAEIQAVEGYERFMSSVGFDDIVDAVRDGPLVYVGAALHEGFAFIVRGRKDVTVHWLPELTAANTAERVESYVRAYGSYRADPAPNAANRQQWREAIDKTTAWLWDAAMRNVVEALGDTSQVTLVPVGVLALLPLHAAWTDDSSNQWTGRRYALDTLIWRYAPNAQAANAARRAAEKIRGDRLVAVDRPSASASDVDLRFSHAEVAAAVAAFPDHQVWGDEQATRQNIRGMWAGAFCAHFSCHGWADPGDPLESSLLLAEEEPLRLREVLGHRLATRLVVLSACESGIPGAELPDEVVSLPAVLLQAGAAAAVASLWAVPGRATAMLMFHFYELWRTGATMTAVEALRQAQQWLRDTTNAEKASYFQQRLPGSGHPMSSPGAQVLWRELFTREPLTREEAHPYYWAAFTYVGA